MDFQKPQPGRRIICWNCDRMFRVNIDDLKKVIEVLVLTDDGQSRPQTAQQKLIVKCPHCGSENEVRV